MSKLRDSWIFDSLGNALSSVLGALKVSIHDKDGSGLSSKNGYLDTISKDHILAVQQGLVPGQEVVWKFGFTDTNNTGSFSTVRAGIAGLYSYAMGYGVNADTVIATSTVPISDSGVQITIEGLDADGFKQVVSTTVNTTTTETWSRVFRAYNSNGTPFVGDITISDTTTTTNLAFIYAVDQQTLQAIYTIPKGYMGYLFQGETAIGSAKEAELNFSIRLFNGVFRTVEKLMIYQNTAALPRPYNPLPELTDIEVRIKPNTNNSLCTSSFGILLVQIA